MNLNQIKKQQSLFFICDLCRKVFLQEEDLIEHTKDEHDKKCKECDLIFNFAVHLTVHVAVHHHTRHSDLKLQKESESLYQCKICLKDLETKDGLTRHIKSHCSKCNNFFFDSNNFKNHLTSCDKQSYFWQFRDGNPMKNIVKLG